MTYRGVYRDGVIVPEGALRLADGTEVDFTVRRKKGATKAAKRKSARRSPAGRTAAEKRIAEFMKGFGILKDDPALRRKSTGAVARELRRRAAGGRFGKK